MDRSELSRALAKVCAYASCKKIEEARQWQRELNRLIDAGLTNAAGVSAARANKPSPNARATIGALRTVSADEYRAMMVRAGNA